MEKYELSEEQLARLRCNGPELTEEEAKRSWQSCHKCFWNLYFPKTLGPEDVGVHPGPRYED